MLALLSGNRRSGPQSRTWDQRRARLSFRFVSDGSETMSHTHQDKQWQRISWNILSNLEQLLVHKYFSYSRGGKLLIISFILSKFKILPTLPAYRTSSTVPHPSSNGHVRLRICIDPDASISPPSVAWQLSSINQAHVQEIRPMSRSTTVLL